ncbi:SDR family oxidoreductase [Aeromicrobium sp. CTD01-1L150]|uniref:SDR family oxidoreductase n=1 Tax=Aeromicrobium sp. CTD01-1L150 TaxID=3341830 RepID=UPI0035C0A7ED
MPRTAPDIAVPDLRGRRAIVTGASDGMGLGIAERLAAAGASVLMPVRNAGKGEAAVDRIRSSIPDADVSLASLDLASLDSVAGFAQTALSDGTPIHVLINNAGVMTPPDRRVSNDGLELQLATNHLGHVALVARLMPLLQAGRARITSQISIAANQHSIQWEDLNWERGYDPDRAYSQSKIMLGQFGLELDRRSRDAGWGISSNLSHPGVAPTNLLAARPELGRARETPRRKLIRTLSARGVLFGTVESAQLPALLAATSPNAHGGSFYGPRGFLHLGGAPAEQPLYSRLTREQEARQTWETSERLAGVTFPA